MSETVEISRLARGHFEEPTNALEFRRGKLFQEWRLWSRDEPGNVSWQRFEWREVPGQLPGTGAQP